MVGGLTIQLMLWSKVFHENGWEVYTFTNCDKNHNKLLEGLKFIHFKQVKFLNILFEQLISLLYIIQIRPSVVITRGASRRLCILSLTSILFGFKLIYMLASDSDVKKGHELIDKAWDRKLFRAGLSLCKYIVTQNHFQESVVNSLYPNLQTLIIPNIWSQDINDNMKKDFILWVGNFRNLKRPMMFLELVKRLPWQQFVMVGEGIDRGLFDACNAMAKEIPNIIFKGPLSFIDTNELFSKSKLFVCTSEIEGFPNTFLQAWSNEVPVISSFDPSDIINIKNLGVVFETVDEAVNAINYLDNQENYENIVNNIRHYFTDNHSPKSQFDRLISTFSLK